jgi:acetyl-CoA carboxylase biotin carboxyl carrier protein
MSLSSRDVEQITRLLEESSFDELLLEMDGLKLHIRRQGATGTALSAAPAPATPAPRAVAAPAAHAAGPAPGPSVDSRDQDVAAPLLGTFYRAPKPGAPAFVEVGSEVQEETVIGIIEVMKLMNAVRAGVRGTVIAVLAQDGNLVEHGEPLLRVRRA